MNLEMSDIVFLGIVLVVGAVALIVGAALGAYSAFRQTKDDEAKAWDRGYRTAHQNVSDGYNDLEYGLSKNPHRLPRALPEGAQRRDVPSV